MAKTTAGQTKKVQLSLTKQAKARRVSKHTMRQSLISGLKQQSGRKDISFHAASKVAARTMPTVPLAERAGYPLTRAKGSVDPKDWRAKNGTEVMVDFGRHAWLPGDWGQGVKMTNPTSHSTGTTGGTYTVMVAPDGKVFYHRKDAEEYAGRSFSVEAGFAGQVRLAQLQAKHAIQLARSEIKEAGRSGGGGLIGTDPDASFFKLLSSKERRCLPDKSEFHFGVVSARRATKPEGVRDIFMVQSQLLEAGVTPTWYVDEASLGDYKALGLRAVVGGKLTAARNMALRHAQSKGKACVQLSDDISAWEYREGPQAKDGSDDSLNAAFAAARRFIVSPVAAARFMLAKMRAADAPKPKLGGVYVLGNCARTFGGAAFSRKNFILGDFLVVDKSNVRFDERMNLKEDYDFTCSHLKTHGSVLRCQRMTLNVKHYANSGGACTNRDKKGREEQRNIDILMQKWPGIFSLNKKRKGEVLMRWKSVSADASEGDVGDASSTAGKSARSLPGNRAGKRGNVRPSASIRTVKKTTKAKSKRVLVARMAAGCPRRV